MTDTDDELTLFVSREHLEELIIACMEKGVMVEVDQHEAARSTIIENIDTLYTTGAWAGGAWTLYRQAPTLLRGKASALGPLGRHFDRKAGGHVIYTNESRQLADGRTSDLDYGMLRVVERKRLLDVDATALITDIPSRLEFANKVKRELQHYPDLEAFGAEAITWDGVADVWIEHLGKNRQRLDS